MLADRLGLRSIKREGMCVDCHYTQQEQGRRMRVVAGVSCESCHGAAADWLAIHADYGGEHVTKEMETPEHRARRLRESIARGMNNPHNVYLIARQCYDCHTVPNERLVNVGGHAAGSEKFELVAWSQGAVRHSFRRTRGTTNAVGPNTCAALRNAGYSTDASDMNVASIAIGDLAGGEVSQLPSAICEDERHSSMGRYDRQPSGCDAPGHATFRGDTKRHRSCP